MRFTVGAMFLRGAFLFAFFALVTAGLPAQQPMAGMNMADMKAVPRPSGARLVLAQTTASR